MTETIIVAVISLAGTLAGSYFAQRKSTVLIAYRIEQLEKEVKEHNNFAKRMPVVEEQIKVINQSLASGLASTGSVRSH